MTQAVGRHTLILGAGASVASPAGLPLFQWIRNALIAPLQLSVERSAWDQLAPEALLSRLHAAGVDVHGEVRRMLSGGSPNALHAMAVEVLRTGNSVWTTNFDELIELAADGSGVRFHRLLPGNDPRCGCSLGHLLKVHGTLSSPRLIASAEDVMLPLRRPWFDRLATDCEGLVVVVGYAGADVDLRSGLRDALEGSKAAHWFGKPTDRAPLRRRFSDAIAANKLTLELSARPDVASLEWGVAHGLTRPLDQKLIAQAREPEPRPTVSAGYEPTPLVRGRVLDYFGRTREARKLYAAGVRHGPHRMSAARALFTSGLIHGAFWRPLAIAALNAACAAPLRWTWPHQSRLPYLAWNVPSDKRLPILERSLVRTGGDYKIALNAANAAKEVDLRRAAELGERAWREAVVRRSPGDAAWASFTLSFAFRWLGEIDTASREAARLTDGYDALAGPGLVACGHFESGAIAALRGLFHEAEQHMQVAIEICTAIGSLYTFDVWCGLLAVRRATGDVSGQRAAYAQARRLLSRDRFRSAYKREVLLIEEGELARQDGRLADADTMYNELAQSHIVGPEISGLLGLGEVQRMGGREPEAAWRALRRSDELGFGYGQVHAAVTLALADAMAVEAAERRIAASAYDAPVRDDVKGLLRYCLGPAPEQHVLCFP